MHDTRLEILINTSDGYADCWQPFFALFKKFWPDCPYAIHLNTERKTFKPEGLDVRPVRSSLDVPADRRRPWGQALLRALDELDAEYTLYLHEDYFLYAPVDVRLIQRFLALMDDRSLNNVRLVEVAGSGPWMPTDEPLLWRVHPSSPYLVGTQAGIWRTQFLRRSVRKHETAWQFEVWGSKRLRRAGHNIHCINRDRFPKDGQEIVPYEPTGITQGRWREDIVGPLFAEHGLEIDFSQRGFYRPDEVRPRFENLPRRALARLRSLV